MAFSNWHSGDATDSITLIGIWWNNRPFGLERNLPAKSCNVASCHDHPRETISAALPAVT